MRVSRSLVLFRTIPTLILGLCCAGAQAAGFAIAATNVTMPPTGTGVSQFSITAIPMTGTITLNCAYSGATTTAKLPVCPLTPPVAFSVTANGTLTGQIAFYPWGVPVPAGLRLGRGSGAGAALAGVLLLGLGLRRREQGWLALMVLAVVCMVGVGACGSSVSNGMTPGTYPYTVTAVNESGSVTPLGQAASTTIYVTVP